MSIDIDYVIKCVQDHFTDGLVLVVGSGLSAAEGMSGMGDLGKFLKSESKTLDASNTALWVNIEQVLDDGEGLEAALLKYPPSDSLESWIAQKTCGLLIPQERKIISKVLKEERNLKLTTLLNKVLKPTPGLSLPIITPNYDRLIEVACEKAGYHVDSTALGNYAGGFDSEKSCMSSCRAIAPRGKTYILDHFPRAVVLKLHGSFDWFMGPSGPVRCGMDLKLDRHIITPGLNKYKAGYNLPFDKCRELANRFIDTAGRLLIIGYGFNDDHLQTHLLPRIQNGTPTLILTRTASEKAKQLAINSPNCLCMEKLSTGDGLTAYKKVDIFDHAGSNYWDIEVLTKELLT